MTDLVVGRSEGVAYANNNLTYSQFRHPVKPILGLKENDSSISLKRVNSMGLSCIAYLETRN